MANRNKDKGKAYERSVAQFLSKFYGDSFTRVPNSGAYVGGKNRERIEHLSANQVLLSKGDIIPPTDYRVVIECKSYNDFPFHQLLNPNQDVKLLDQWIKETEYDAGEDPWMLFFKISRRGEYVVYSRNLMKPEVGAIIYKKYAVSEKEWLFTEWGERIEKNIKKSS